MKVSRTHHVTKKGVVKKNPRATLGYEWEGVYDRRVVARGGSRDEVADATDEQVRRIERLERELSMARGEGFP